MTTKKKIGTVLDEELLRRAKMPAAREGIPLSHLLEKALQAYLGQGKRSVADEMWGAIRIDPVLLKQMMEEEESAIETDEEGAPPKSNKKSVPGQPNRYSLRGLPFTYIDPTEPVAEEEWEAAS